MQLSTPLICVPVKESTMAEAFLEIQKVQEKADVVEIWLDHIRDLHIDRLFSIKKKPYLCVCKSKREKGLFKGLTETRLDILKKCIDLKCEYIDFNIEVPIKWLKKMVSFKGRSKLILSYHNFSHTPSFRVLFRIAAKMIRLNTDIIKIVTFIKNTADIASLFQLAHSLIKQKKEHIIIGMGEKGKITRIASPLLQNHIMFAPLELSKQSAPGQLTVDELRTVWNNY